MLFERADIIFKGSYHTVKGSVNVDYEPDGERYEYDQKINRLIDGGLQVEDIIVTNEPSIEIVNETPLKIENRSSLIPFPKIYVSQHDLAKRLS